MRLCAVLSVVLLLQIPVPLKKHWTSLGSIRLSEYDRLCQSNPGRVNSIQTQLKRRVRDGRYRFQLTETVSSDVGHLDLLCLFFWSSNKPVMI